MSDATHVSFSDIQMYLEAIAALAKEQGNDVDISNHLRFWNTSYQEFTTGNVPGESCEGAPIPIVNADPAQCPFYQALTYKTGWCELEQMPRYGPYITNPGYEVTLSNGVKMTGAEIDANIVWWLTNGMPET